MSGDEIEFVNAPPPDRRGPIGEWSGRLAILRGRPGEWARFPQGSATSASQTVHRLKARGRVSYGGAKPGEFEATQRTLDGETFVYVRYVGHLRAVEDAS